MIYNDKKIADCDLTYFWDDHLKVRRIKMEMEVIHAFNTHNFKKFMKLKQKADTDKRLHPLFVLEDYAYGDDGEAYNIKIKENFDKVTRWPLETV